MQLENGIFLTIYIANGVSTAHFKFHGKHFFGSLPCDHGNPSETAFRFLENKSWEPIFYTIDLNKHIIISKI